MAALFMTATSSCKKDNNDEDPIIPTPTPTPSTPTVNNGVFNPSQKISKYYYWDEYDEEKVLQEIWNWEGKQLSSIDYVNWDGTVYETEYFTYENNRLSRVDYNRTYLEFKYANGKLNKLFRYYDYELEGECTFSYDSNNKISEINIVYYEGKKSEKGMLNPLGLFLPEQVVKRLERRNTTRNVKDDGVETVSVKLTWDGDNVSKIVAEGEYSEEGFSESFSEDYTFYYDNKNNPKYGFMNQYSPDIEGFSKNNFTRYICAEREMEYENGVLVDDDTYTYEYHFTYQYDESNYPIEITRNRSSSGGDTSTDKYFYEYLH